MIEWVMGIISCLLMFLPYKRMYAREGRSKLMAFCVVAGFVGIVLLYKSVNWVGTVSESDDPNSFRASLLQSNRNVYYGIMFDAGSTGSRMHAFKFESTGTGKPGKFLDDKFLIVKPGLSSFAKDPQAGAKSLVDLLDAALDYIPQDKHKLTPIALKATAGLRMLPGTESDALLSAVRNLLTKYPFMVFDDSVEIMGGMDEGIFSWFTLNFFMEALSNINNTLGMMDLGGGSTQVTFVPKETTTIHGPQAGDVTNIDVFGVKHRLYTRSYLGLGLMAARFGILAGKNAANDAILQSACLLADKELKWTHGGKEYSLKGSTQERQRFEPCYKLCVEFLKGKIQHVKEVDNDLFSTISYYYDRAVDYGLIDKGKEGKNLTVSEYFEAAKIECQKKNPRKAFLCFDLTYLSALLHNGFGFKKDAKLMVIKHVHGREISWALGAMFDFFNKHNLQSS